MAGWRGPVVLVGSVEEAREFLQDAPAPRPPAEEVRAGRPARPWLMLDPDRQVVTCADAEEHLTRLEFGFLKMLLEQPGRVQAFADLTDRVWGTRYLGDVSQVHSLVKRLRRKLDTIHSPLQVQAVRGVGFRMVRPADRGSEEPEPRPRLLLDEDGRRVVHGNAARRLTPLEFAVLQALLRAPGHALRYAQLVGTVWGVPYTGDATALHAVVRRLRRKLGEIAAPVQVESVRGTGFRLLAPEEGATPGVALVRGAVADG